MTTTESDTSPASPQKNSWLRRLRDGLTRSTTHLTGSISGLFTKKRLDRETLAELEAVLIRADLGASVAARVVRAFGKERLDKEITEDQVRDALATIISGILKPYAKPLVLRGDHKPHVVLCVGVNGNGKTTTLGKLSAQWHTQGHSVTLAACDTFRAAAVAQLEKWGERAGCPVLCAPEGSDPAALAFRALSETRTQGGDALLIDTAGRLHNRADLMEELAKIVRVLQKQDPTAPHDVLLVLDATTGQNALAQVKTFQALVGVTGLVVTKLDGTARGGILVALAETFRLPIHAIGVGEGVDDLQAFDAETFARALVGG